MVNCSRFKWKWGLAGSVTDFRAWRVWKWLQECDTFSLNIGSLTYKERMPTCILIKVIYLILLKESINISLDQRSRIFQNLNGALGEMEEGSSFLLGVQLHADTRNKVVLWLKGLNFGNSCPCRISLSKKPLPEFWDLFAIPLQQTRFSL